MQKIQENEGYMVKSMTGYGRGEARIEGGKLIFELRTLNSKNADISIKSSLLPKDKELAVRKRLAEKLTRGTIDLYITWEPDTKGACKGLNTALAGTYYLQLTTLARELGIEKALEHPEALLASVLRMPDIVDVKNQDLVTEDNWPEVEAALETAIGHLEVFRQKEGAILRKDVTQKVEHIFALVDEIERYDKERVEYIREDLFKKIEELKLSLDKQRFEQEMIYYLEKLDINEEKVRLRQHCRYFLDTLENEEACGKKLGFIAQEMGREINTTGAKANHAEIQKIVVRMKDELEKIKEQSLNIL